MAAECITEKQAECICSLILLEALLYLVAGMTVSVVLEALFGAAGAVAGLLVLLGLLVAAMAAGPRFAVRFADLCVHKAK